MNRMVAGTIAGVAVGASVAQTISRRARDRAMAAFYDSNEPVQRVTVDGREVWLPIVIHRMDAFGSLHSASMEVARELLPSEALHPVGLPGGRAAVMISAFRYYEMTDSRPAPAEPVEPPYAEVTATILATTDSRAPVLSLAMMGTGLAPTGGYVPHMAVTHRLARGGRAVWGVPKFVADADFIDDVASREVRLAEGERHILTLVVQPTGRLQTSTRPSVMYTVLDGDLVETRMPAVMESRIVMGPGHGRLELGGDGHPVTETLRRLDLSPEAVVVFDAPVVRTKFAPGVVIGKGRRVVDYEGTDRAYGRFTVRHPGTGPIDQNAVPALASIWPGPGAIDDLTATEPELVMPS